MGRITRIVTTFVFFVVSTGCKSQNSNLAYNSDALKIKQLTAHSYLHISVINIPNYGSFECNSLVYLNAGEAVVFDTPVSDYASNELIRWITEEKKHKISAVVINHFHGDALGGLKAFHEKEIPSYANNKTIALLDEEKELPKNGFDQLLRLRIGEAEVINQFFGEAHSPDNIVSYIPSEKVLFGGCMVKSINAKKGNLEDANLKEWSNTIRKIKKAYPEVELVIPGHGEPGNSALLDYTISLFSTE